MPSLSQSPVLQALGYAIANSLWQMALVWIVFVLLNSVFKFKSEIKFRIAVAAQVIGFAWFIVTLQFYYRQCSQAVELAESIVYPSGEQPYILSSSEGSLLSWFIQAEQLLPYLSVAYLLLLAFLVIRWFRAYRYTQLVRLNGLHKIHVEWKLFVTKVAGQLGIKPKVRIFLSEIVKSPVTIGFLKPVILIPIASINHLTPEQMEAVILHELAHIKRHDYLLNIVLSIIELGLFFNPFTRLITKSISKERENSCDDWVLQYQYNPSMYAQALLQIAVLQHQPSMAMYAAKSKSELVSRVQRMVHQKDSRFNYRHQLVALLMMTGILASLAWFDPATVRKTRTKPAGEAQAIMLEPLAARIDNPLFNPVFFLNKPLQEEAKKTLAENKKRTRRLERV
ncbi:MAG TPA: M56 family metallopeptidase, partial [Chitinophagaceae bacterium]